MKHYNQEGREGYRPDTKWFRYFGSTFIAAIVAIGVSACGKKDGGGQPAVAPGVAATCVGCSPTATSLIGSALGRAFNYQNQEMAQLSLNFYGEAAQVQAGQTGGSLYYNGQTVVGGVLRVRIPRNSQGYCQIPAGDYTVTTLTPGQWYGMQVNQVQLQAAGPAVLQITLRNVAIGLTTPAAVDWAGLTFPYRIQYSEAWVTSSSAGGYCGQFGPEYYFTAN